MPVKAIPVLGFLIFAAACGGGEDAVPVTTGQQTQQLATDTGDQVVMPTGETQLVREVFTYRGSGRNPFISLLQSGDVRPLIQDLRVTTITYDARYPAASVAVLRDTIVNKAYTVRVGDELGRMRVAEITPGQVVVILAEFGAERQVVLRQRRRGEIIP